eukprot:3626066-Rhodomonas_salina.1
MCSLEFAPPHAAHLRDSIMLVRLVCPEGLCKESGGWYALEFFSSSESATLHSASSATCKPSRRA